MNSVEDVEARTDWIAHYWRASRRRGFASAQSVMSSRAKVLLLRMSSIPNGSKTKQDYHHEYGILVSDYCTFSNNIHNIKNLLKDISLKAD
jgi:hypothetical protein